MQVILAHPIRSILVVEDESILRMMAVDMFEEAGYIVIQAGTGEEGALILSGGAPIAGVFTDIEMPGSIDGLSLARIARERHPDAAIMIVSGRRSPSRFELPLNALFFGKPYSPGRVLGIMNIMLGHEAAAVH